MILQLEILFLFFFFLLCLMLSRKELVDPSGLSEEQLKEIPYTKIE